VAHRDYKNLRDVDRTTADLDELRLNAISDLQDLRELFIRYLRKRSSNMRVDEDSYKRRLQRLATRFEEYSLTFQRIVDAVHGREDWTRLSPKDPAAVKTAPPEKDAKPRTPDSTSSNPRITISAPPSPYQATVEEVEDEPSDEPSLVESYHYIHPQETPPVAPEPPSVPTPPVVMVRAPTDLEEQAGPSSKAKQSPDHAYASEFRVSDADKMLERPSKRSEGRTQRGDKSGYDATIPSRVLTRYQSDERPIEDIHAEILYLEAELGRMDMRGEPRDEPAESSGKRKIHHPSMDLGTGIDGNPLEPHPGMRHRAMTTPSVERLEGYQGDVESRKSRRTPKASPANRPYDYAGPAYPRTTRDSPRQAFLRPNHSPRTPQSAVETGSSPWLPNDAIDEGCVSNPKNRYGGDPRHSFPDLGTAGGSGSGPQRNGPSFVEAKRKHRYSENYGAGRRPVDVDRAFTDWLNSDEGRMGDFDLFGPSPLDDQGVSACPSRRPTDPSSSRGSPASRRGGERDAADPRTASAAAAAAPAPAPSAAIERELHVTLEELFHGSEKQFEVRRTSVDAATGVARPETQPLKVPVYRGLRAGTKIKFLGEAGVSPAGVPIDLHFIVVEKPHPLFTRRGVDLHAVIEISLAESLLGWQRTLTSIDGKTVRVGHEGPTPPGWQEPFAGLGMCNSKNVQERGDLIVGVKIRYPGALSDRQKALIKAALMDK